jgi:TRAP-type transport system periplasmic protein
MYVSTVLRATTIASLALLSTALLGAAGVRAQAPQFTMKLSSPTVNDSTQEYMKAFKAGVEERSKGKIKVELYPANQLGQIPATVDGVALGTIELTMPAIGFFIGIEPRYQMLEAAGLFDSMAHGMKVLGDPAIRARLATFGEAKGVEPLFTILHGDLIAISNKPIRTISDFNGLKLRVPGAAPLQTEPFKKLGVSPLAMPLGEVLPALQNKAIDGATLTYPVIMAFKYFDVTKTATRLPSSYTIVSGLANRRFLKSLGAELEAIVREESIKAETKFSEWGITEHARVQEAWTKVGGESINLSAADAKTYQDGVDAVVATVTAANPKMKEDYEALVATAKKYR